MAIVFNSVQTAAYTKATGITVTKPTSLAAGDLMVAALTHQDNELSGVTFTLPSGWTSISNTPTTSGSYDQLMAVFYKVADSSDVAASNFTFNTNNSYGTGLAFTAGSLSRITSYGHIDASVRNGANPPSTSFATGITPEKANSLILFYTTVGQDGTATASTFSSQAIATDNPTWTEQFDISFASVPDTRGGGFALATAVRSQITAFGNASLSYSSGSADSGVNVIVVITPQVDGSVAPDAATTNVYALSPIQSTKAEAVVQEPTVNEYSPTVWTPITKS